MKSIILWLINYLLRISGVCFPKGNVRILIFKIKRLISEYSERFFFAIVPHLQYTPVTLLATFFLLKKSNTMDPMGKNDLKVFSSASLIVLINH